MIIGLLKKDGTKVLYQDVKPQEWEQYGASPATLIYLKNQGKRREGVGGLTASQYGKGLRLLWLERTVDVFVPADESVAALMGTAKHSHILTEGYNDDISGVVTELRLFDTDRKISAQIDQVVTAPDGTVELWDFKSGKMYSLKMYNAEKDTHHYTYQLNLGADLYEQQYPDTKISALRIEWIPSDSGKEDDGLIIVDVPRWEYGVALAAYRGILSGLESHLASKTAPEICSPEERWERFDKRTKETHSIRCEFYCPYFAACKERAVADDQIHPAEVR